MKIKENVSCFFDTLSDLEKEDLSTAESKRIFNEQAIKEFAKTIEVYTFKQDENNYRCYMKKGEQFKILQDLTEDKFLFLINRLNINSCYLLESLSKEDLELILTIYYYKYSVRNIIDYGYKSNYRMMNSSVPTYVNGENAFIQTSLIILPDELSNISKLEGYANLRKVIELFDQYDTPEMRYNMPMDTYYNDYAGNFGNSKTKIMKIPTHNQ
jgi:hypothetical protein